MGNQKSEFQQRFSNNYGFIQALQDPVYGFVKVYRKKFQNYHYVMVIDRRLQEFNNRTFMTDCMRPNRNVHSTPQKGKPISLTPKLFVKDNDDTMMEYNSMKLNRLRRTLQLIKRYQDQLMVPLFSYQIVNGSKLQCTQPVIQLYVQFQNHRLIEYLEVLRTKCLPLKAKQITYILKCVCLGIIQLEKMQIEVTTKEINIHNIFTSNEGQVKLHPIEILTKKQHERQNLQNIQNIKSQSSTNPSIQAKKIALGKSVRSSSSVHDKRSSDEKNSKNNYLKDRDILFSSNQSLSSHSSKLTNHKEILQKLLIELSPYCLLKNSEGKDLQAMNTIIGKSSSISQIHSNLQKHGNPCIQGLLVQRIYDFNENQNNNNLSKKQNNNDKLSTSNMSNTKSSVVVDGKRSDSINNFQNSGVQNQRLNNQKQLGQSQMVNQYRSNYYNPIGPPINNYPVQNFPTNTFNSYVNQKTNIVQSRNDWGKYETLSKISQVSYNNQMASTINYNNVRQSSMSKQPDGRKLAHQNRRENTALLQESAKQRVPQMSSIEQNNPTENRANSQQQNRLIQNARTSSQLQKLNSYSTNPNSHNSNLINSYSEIKH